MSDTFSLIYRCIPHWLIPCYTHRLLNCVLRIQILTKLLLCLGFSNNQSTWLPVNPNYWWLNVEAQRTSVNTHLKVFQALMKARKDPVLQYGDVNVLAPDNDTLVVVR